MSNAPLSQSNILHNRLLPDKISPDGSTAIRQTTANPEPGGRHQLTRRQEEEEPRLHIHKKEHYDDANVEKNQQPSV